MESEESTQSITPDKCCNCGCSCSNGSYLGTLERSVKRKYEEFEGEVPFTIPGFIMPQNARIDMGNECITLRETVGSQQLTIQDLIAELEEERNASSSATSEAMSMILRLQREKADIQMEARQFQRFAEEKMAHDQEEILAMDDLLYKRDEIIQSITCEVQAYKHRMMSYGLTEAEADGDRIISSDTVMIENPEGELDFPLYKIYPPLKCSVNQHQAYNDVDDEAFGIEKHAFGEIPTFRDQLMDLEHRIKELEGSPKTIQPVEEYMGTENVLEKAIVGPSPRHSRHLRKFSSETSNSLYSSSKEIYNNLTPDSPNSSNGLNKFEFLHVDENSDLNVDNASEVSDEMSDRVYTIDSVHQKAPLLSVMDPSAVATCQADHKMTSGEPPNYSSVRDLEIQKLYARLHALEADRESMRQAIVSIGTEKAQLVLLKEIAQNFCKGMSPAQRIPVRKESVVQSFSFFSIFKWIITFVFWRKKACQSKFASGLSANHAGLRSLLDQNPRVGLWRSISST